MCSVLYPIISIFNHILHAYTVYMYTPFHCDPQKESHIPFANQTQQ